MDKDGDLVMDAVAGTESRGGRGRPEGSQSRGRASGSGRGGRSSGVSRGAISTLQAQQAIIRGLGSQQVNVHESHLSHGASKDRGRNESRHNSGAVVELRVYGLKESKAASKSDGGLKDLIAFLERKATGVGGNTRKTVMIKKVCCMIKITGIS